MPARTLSVFLSVGLVVLFALPVVQAQINGVPASVTSFGFGGSTSPAPGVRASVTSLGPNGYGDTPHPYGGRGLNFGTCCFGSGFQTDTQLFPRHRREHHDFAYGPIMYPVPYTQVVVVPPEEATDENDEVASDPQVLRLRLPREDEAAPQPKPAPAAAPATDSPPAPNPVPAQPTTLLVFKDGHKAEVQNYAIVGGTLFEFGDGRTKKIPLADLDLPATEKANDDQGVDFKLPATRK
jgi:hypothetical protein